MRLLIISNMAHFHKDGSVIGHGPTAREISYLAKRFDEVRHIACIHSEEAVPMSLPYDAKNLRLILLPPTGGKKVMDKCKVLVYVPLYSLAILRELRAADMVHVRCPANIPLIAIILLALVAKPRMRWIKYAGNWQPTGKEALTYRFQRWWLRNNFARATVSVNGIWEHQPAHIRGFYNPCLTDEEVKEGRIACANKSINDSLRLIFVGRLEVAKGIDKVLEIVKNLHNSGTRIIIDIVGDGPERARSELFCSQNQLEDVIRFHGWLPRNQINKLYMYSHIILLPSSGEGWPKVLSEAMAYGTVPVSSDVGSMPYYLAKFDTGCAIPLENPTLFETVIISYLKDSHRWSLESQNAANAARYFTYSYYLNRIEELINETKS